MKGRSKNDGDVQAGAGFGVPGVTVAADPGELPIGSDGGSGGGAFARESRGERHGGIDGREPIDAAVGKTAAHRCEIEWHEDEISLTGGVCFSRGGRRYLL